VNPQAAERAVTWAPLVVLAMLPILGACAAHTAIVRMDGAESGESVCAVAREAAATAASEFSLRSAVPPGTGQPALTDGSIVLARFRSTGGLIPPLEGSRHTVYLTVFAKNGCRNVEFAATDYDQAHETEYVRLLQARLLDLLRRGVREAEFTVTQTTTRALPP